VRGYKKELISVPNATYIDNDKWEHTGVMYSLSLAAATLDEPYVVLFSDVFFKRYILHSLVQFSADITADVVMVCVKENYINNGYSLLSNRVHDIFRDDRDIYIKEVAEESTAENKHGGDILFFTGLMLVKNHQAVKLLLSGKDRETLTSRSLFIKMLEKRLKIAAIVTSTDAVVDINYAQDVMKAEDM
jgi:choline kinase